MYGIYTYNGTEVNPTGRGRADGTLTAKRGQQRELRSPLWDDRIGPKNEPAARDGCKR